MGVTLGSHSDRLITSEWARERAKLESQESVHVDEGRKLCPWSVSEQHEHAFGLEEAHVRLHSMCQMIWES